MGASRQYRDVSRWGTQKILEATADATTAQHARGELLVIRRRCSMLGLDRYAKDRRFRTRFHCSGDSRHEPRQREGRGHEGQEMSEKEVHRRAVQYRNAMT